MNDLDLDLDLDMDLDMEDTETTGEVSNNSTTGAKEANSAVPEEVMAPKLYDINDYDNQSSALPERSYLETIKLNENVASIYPFTREIEPAHSHYIDDPEFQGSVRCLKDYNQDCPACQGGMKSTQRLLTPVLDMVSQEIKILPIPGTKSPSSLKPQYIRIVNATIPTIANITRNGAKYAVKPVPVTDRMNIDMQIIEQFQESMEAGEVSLSDIYTTYTYDELAAIPSIATKMLLNGYG